MTRISLARIYAPGELALYIKEVTPSMEVVQEKRADILFLSLKGRIDDNNAQSLEENLIKLIDNGAKELIIDCSQIEFINNAGLRTLLNVSKRALNSEGRIALHSPSQPAKEIFDKTGFSMVS